jgi:parallel beta-helix repeat protein
MVFGCGDDGGGGAAGSGGAGATGGSGGGTGICDTGFGGFPAPDCGNLPDLTAYSVGDFYSPVPVTRDDDCTVTVAGDDVNSNNLNVILDGATRGDVICIAEGTYDLDATLTIAAVEGLTLKGIGPSPDDTVLSFGGPGTGNGITVQQDNVTIENMWVKNTGINGIQQEEVTGSKFRKLHVSWDDFCVGPRAPANCNQACSNTEECGDELLICADLVCDAASDNPGDSCTNDGGCPNGACLGVCIGNISRNGAYAVYPTDCQDTLVEYSQLQGASDAGIYVGKCGWGDDTTVGGLVQYNVVSENVLGLEVENSLDVIVHHNTMVNNSAGLFAYQTPNVGSATPSNTNISWYANDSYCNNHPNFAATGAAQIAPPGTGALIVSGDGQELCNNNIQGNVTGGVLIVSSFFVCQIAPPEECSVYEGYVPYAINLYIHDNFYADNGTSPQGEFAPLFLALGIGTPQDPVENVFWDGYIYPDAPDGDPRICLGADYDSTYRDMTDNQCQDVPSGDLGGLLVCASNNDTTDTAGRLCDAPL